MDLTKIGNFIAERRKNANLTQMQLAEMLNITDRAVSKWETGRALPDSSIMIELCDILKISVNDLLSGEVVSMEDYNKEMQDNLLEMIKQKEEADKRLLSVEILVGVISTLFLLASCLVSAFLPVEEWIRVVIILIGLIPLLVALPFMLKIEQTAGYYECKECGHRYIPTFSAVLWAMHAGRTRYMKCPNCGKRSWQKKVINKESDK